MTLSKKGKYSRPSHPSRPCWLYRSEPGRYITAMLVSAAILVALFLYIRPVFMTIDDARLNYVYAGYSSGQPEEVYLFCLYPLSWVISNLYRLFPGVQWYALYQFGVIGLSSALIGKTDYKIAWKRGVKFPVAVAIHVMLYTTVALISTILMHFEITAALAGTAAVALLVGMDFQRDPLPMKIVDSVLAVCCIAASYVIQANAFYSACCYLLVCLVVIVLGVIRDKAGKKVLPQVLCLLLCMVVAFGAVKMLDNHVKDTPVWDEYREYNKYRVSFWDYPHVTYQENPELFEQIGWTEEFYKLTQSMYFMDSRFNQENLSQIVNRFSWFDFSDPEKLVSTASETLSELYRTERLVVAQSVVMLLLLIVTLTKAFSKKNWKNFFPQLTASFCAILGTVVLALYLASRGRLPLRAWLAFAIPCITVTTLLLLSMKEFPKKTPDGERSRGKTVLRVCAGAAALLAWAAGLLWVYSNVIDEDWTWRAERNEMTGQMEAYVASHPENVYVYDLMGAQNYNVFAAYPDPDYRPDNAFVWGSSYLWTPAYLHQLENCGRTQLLTEDLLSDDVFFISYNNRPYKEMLEQMLLGDYGAVTMTPVDSIGNYYTVYKIEQG